MRTFTELRKHGILLSIRTPRCQNLRGREACRVRNSIASLSDDPSSALKGLVPTAGTPSPSPSTVSSDSVSALPSWLLVTLFALVVLIIVAMFAITAYNLSAPRSTLKNLIGSRRSRMADKANAPPPPTVDPAMVKMLATAARVNTRTTRTTLAIAGFSLLGVAVVAVFGLSGQGVRDLRTQVVAAVTTLVAAISGFYFGARTAEVSTSGTQPTSTAPGLAPDPKNPSFTVGQAGTYTPVLTGTPPPTVSLSGDPLPPNLNLNPNTGVISGTPNTGTGGTYHITLTGSNGISPDATLPVTITVS